MIYRFDQFTLDTTTSELMEGDRPTGLPPQPVRALAFLVARAGQLVTREELREHLWPGRYAEFDQGLNTCIRRIRRALRDTVDTPRYVETLSGRGYRFVGHVSPAETATRRSGSERPRRRSWRLAAAAGVLLTAVAVAAGAWSRASSDGPGVRVAVLPFESLDADPANEYLRIALADEVITRLAMLDPARLGVIARGSAMRFDRTRETPASIGAALGADFLLVGSIRGSADSVRVVAQLVRVDDGTYLWAEAFDKGRDDLLDLERELARRVTSSIAPSLLAGSPVTPAQALPAVTYTTYLKAKYFLSRGGPGGVDKSISLLEAVVREAPRYGRALTELGVAYARAGRFEDARRSALLALGVDSTDADAHVLMANSALRVDWDPDAAEAHHQRALELAPASPLVNHSYAAQLSTRGDHKAVVRYLRRALETDPISPSVNADLGWHYFRAGRYQQALDQCRTTLELVAGHSAARRCLLHANVRLGRLEEARRIAMDLMRGPGVDSTTLAAVERSAPAHALAAYFQWRVRQVAADPSATRYDLALRWPTRDTPLRPRKSWRKPSGGGSTI